MLKYLNGNWVSKVQDKAGEGNQGGGGGSASGAGAGGAASGTQNNGSGDSGDYKTKFEEQAKRNDELEKRLKFLEGNRGNAGSGDDDGDLAAKARKEREQNDKSNLDQKKLESAVKFGLQSEQWLKDNASLLPKTIPGIFEQAAKENYGNAIEKDGAIKAGIIQEFFSQQSNLELLTPGPKSALEEFNKLTKNVKQERAQSIWDTVFEPTFEALKRQKKAEQLSKGIVDPSNAEAAYKDKMVGLSRKHYLGEKNNGT